MHMPFPSIQVLITLRPKKSTVKAMFAPRGKSSANGRGIMSVEDLDIRPGGMLVQKRNPESNQNPILVPTIKVRVKYGSSCHDIHVSSQASFGELKKMLAEYTGVHPQDQKLIYKKKERDSKAFLDVARVKDGSKIVLVEDITSRERRCLEMLKSAKTEKASKSLQQISLEVAKLGEKVKSLEAVTSAGDKVAEKDGDELTEMLMSKLVAMEGISVEGDLKLQKQMQERRVQKYVETLDALKLQNSSVNGNRSKIILLQKENSMEKASMPTQKQPGQPKQTKMTGPQLPMQKQPVQHNQTNITALQMPIQMQPPMSSQSVVVTTKWETFD